MISGLYTASVQVPQQSRLIRRVCGEHDWRLERILADPAGFANQSVNDAQVYEREGVGLTRGDNKREQGWRRLGELLDETLDDGYAALVVIEGKAPNLVRTLPILLADPLHSEDVSQDRRVHVLRKKQRPFTGGQIRLLETFAAQAVVAVVGRLAAGGSGGGGAWQAAR